MSGSFKSQLGKISSSLTQPNARFYALAAFIALVFFTGGSSRDDIQSLVILRPMAALFAAYALTCAAGVNWKGRLFPLYIAIAVGTIMALQLIPLPPSIWTALPERQIFADIADTAGIAQPWRPLSLSPSRTLNSLLSLIIPVTAMMLYLNLEQSQRGKVIPVLIIISLLSAIWGVFQLAGPSRGPLYLYKYANFGTPVGLFANRNHQAVLLAASTILLGWYGGSHAVHARLAALKFYGSIAAIFVLTLLIFITGSRAGLVLLAPSLVLAMTLIYFGRYSAETSQSLARKKGIGNLSPRQLILFGSFAGVVSMGILAVYFSRSLAYDRLFGSSDLGGLRTQLLPTLTDMISDYFPLGSGFGTFEHIYRIHEPQELLGPTYLNQAHNDLLQLPLEGGLPIMIAGLFAIFWFVRKLLKLAKFWKHSRYSKYIAIAVLGVILVLLAASIGDYPLRIPSLMVLFALMACLFNDAVQLVQQKDIKRE